MRIVSIGTPTTVRIAARLTAAPMQNRVLAFLICLTATAGLFTSPNLLAQSGTTIIDSYDDSIKGAQTVSSDGFDTFGESVYLKDGATAFNVIDIDLRTNSSLPVALGRSLRLNTRDASEYTNPASDGNLFGNWQLDVPYISGIFDERTGWVSSMPNGNQRCSISGWGASGPPSVESVYSSWNTYYLPEEYWSGNSVNIPGAGQHPMLYLPPDKSRPADGRTYYWTTKGNWRVGCVPALKNGSGEGFLVVLPDGTKYTFDWISSRKVSPLKASNCVSTALYNSLFNQRPSAPATVQFGRPPLTWEGGFNTHYAHAFEGGGGSLGGCALSTQVVVNRREYFLHATKVEDRFGNWVAYGYDAANPRRLTSIKSNDGASLSLVYGTNGKITSAATGDRVWRYEYTEASGRALAAVVQPDGSRWTYQYGDLGRMLHPERQKVIWVDCEPKIFADATESITIGHPAGSTGVFTFKTLLHGTDRTPGGCSIPNPNRPLQVDLSQNLMTYKVASLISKQISGPGLPTMTWSYQYQPSWSWNPTGYVDDCAWEGANCNGTTVTSVAGPDGTVTRSVFGNDYYRNAGQLLREEIVSNGAVIRTVTSTYMLDSNGQSYSARVGWDPNLSNNRFETEFVRPLRATSTSQDGATFTWEVDACSAGAYCFDNYARPTRVKRHSSLGYSKREEISYHDNPVLWVLGQVASQTDVTTGMTISRTDFWPSTALPKCNWKFGKLQSCISYNADGTLATATDGRNHTVTLSNWFRGIPRLIQHPDKTTESAVVNDAGWITARTNEAGFSTGYGYDVAGRLASIVHPSGDTVTWNNWNSYFRPLTAADWKPPGIAAGQWHRVEWKGDDRKITYFDTLWRPVVQMQYDESDILGTRQSTRTVYDSSGRVSFRSYPSAQVIPPDLGEWTTYDAIGRLKSVSQDSEQALLTTLTEYLPGFQTRTTNPRGVQVTSRFMAWDEPDYGLMIHSVQPEDKVVEISRHPQFGWPLHLKQRSTDNVVQSSRYYVYDGAGQLCKTIEPETGATVMGYDDAGNLAWSAAGHHDLTSTNSCNHIEGWNGGRRVDRSYDVRNRLTALSFPDGRGNQAWRYTPDGLPESITTYNDLANGAPVVNAYSYNKRRMVAGESVSQPGSYTWGIGYGYDANGSLSTQTYPTGLVVNYAPNALGQPTRAGSYATGVQYYPNGAIKQFTYGNGIVHAMTQNVRQLPARVVDSGNALDHAYVYDTNGNVESIQDNGVGTPTLQHRYMQYDGLDRLKAVGSQMFGGDHWHHFSYDALDNLKSWKLAGVKDYANYTYDTKNRLTNIKNTAGATVTGLDYDVQGNLANKNGQLYTFDFGNRLRSVPGRESYRYDGAGRRVQTTRADGTQTVWQYSQTGQMLFSMDSAATQKTHENVYLGGSLVATIDHDWPSNAITAIKYQHTDALGSPVAVTNTAGVVIERTNYEPYGAAINKTVNGIGYAGHVMDKATGLTYMQQRYYDPSVGRFLSNDPVTADASTGANFNRYWYANNSPYRYSDPDGRQSLEIPRAATSSMPLAPCYTPGACRSQTASRGLYDGLGYLVDNADIKIEVAGTFRNVGAQLDFSSRTGDVQLKALIGKGETGIPYGYKAAIVLETAVENPDGQPFDASKAKVGSTMFGSYAGLSGGLDTAYDDKGQIQFRPRIGLGGGVLKASGTLNIRTWNIYSPIDFEPREPRRPWVIDKPIKKPEN